MIEKNRLIGKGIWNISLWLGLGFTFLTLNLFADPSARSPYWFVELGLYALMLAGLWANVKYDFRKKIRIPRPSAPAVYIFLVWLSGMVYETSLTVNGKGIGGVHPETLPSFILAQGDYIPIAIVSYLVIRKTKISFHELFFFAGGMSLTEGLIFTGVLTTVLLSPQFFIAPLTLGYYTIAYSSFIALPLLLIDEELLWQKFGTRGQHSIPYYWMLGFILAFAIRVFWGLAFAPAVTTLLQLPAIP